MAKSLRSSIYTSHTRAFFFVAAVTFASVSVDAQTASTQGAALDEIIVTAQKRDENLQNIPLSITAITGNALEDMGAHNVSDIARFVPGLAVATTGPGQSEVIIRGIASGIALDILGNVATVGYYLDETPVSDVSRNLDAALVDLERVEVLRGPQGTLYGTSSMGGTIRYITHQPDLNQFSGKTEASLSHTQNTGEWNREIEAVLNVPLIAGKLAVRATGFFQGWGGYIDRYSISPDAYQGIDPSIPVQRNVNSSRLGGGRFSVKYQPNDYLEFLPTVMMQKTEVDEPYTIDKPTGSVNNPIQVRLVSEPASDEVKLASLTTTLKLHQLEIVSATSYFDRDADSIEDWSKLAAFILEEDVFPFIQATRFSQRSWTEELRASMNWERVHGVVGLYYQYLNSGLVIDDPVYPGYNEKFGTAVDSFFTTDESTRTKARAVFAEFNFDLTSKLTLTVGDRASHAEQTHAAMSDGYFNGGPSQNSDTTDSSSNTPKFGLSYQATPDILAYVTVAKGARPGGAQHFVPVPFCTPYLNELGLTDAPKQYRPDSLWSYEVGAKNRLADGRLVVNASAFYVDWKSIQQEVDLACGFPIITNFGKATSKGAELSTTFRLTPGWTLSGNAAYTDATARNQAVGIAIQSGDPLLNTPRWAYGVGTDFAQPVSSSFEVFSHLDYSYTGWTAAIFDRTSPFYRRPSYSLVNVNLGLRNGSRHWQAQLFIDNLTNKHADTGFYFSNTGNSAYPPDVHSVGVNRPRTLGVRAEFDF